MLEKFLRGKSYQALEQGNGWVSIPGGV